jgi:hypothetical protein
MVIDESDVMAVSLVKSRLAQRVKIRDFLAQRGLDADVQRHMRARAPGAHPRQPDSRRIPIYGDEFDIAPISLEVRPHTVEDSLNTFFRNHE